jgi:hypothetical protein
MGSDFALPNPIDDFKTSGDLKVSGYHYRWRPYSALVFRFCLTRSTFGGDAAKSAVRSH